MRKNLLLMPLVALVAVFHQGCYAQAFEHNAGIVKMSSGSLTPPSVPSRQSSSVEIAPNIYLLRWSDSSRSVSAEADTLKVISGLASASGVQYAHPNWKLSLAGVGDPGYEPPEYYPSDTLYPDQWTFFGSYSSVVWNYWTSGSSSVKIGVIDTGRTDHPDLINKWHPFLEYNAVNQTFDAEDNGTWAHGTAVASVAAAEGYNSEGIMGACPYCTLVPIKVSDDSNYGEILISYLVDAIDWARLNQIDVINLSLETGGNCAWGEYSALNDAITNAVGDGVVVIAAAGNQAEDAQYTIPASCPGVISVAALDQSLSLAPYSNYGDVDIAAPAGGGTLSPNSDPRTGLGEGIGCPAGSDDSFNPFQLGAIVAWKTPPSGVNAYCYRYLSGTSLAAPFVAGVAGMMRSANDQITPAEVLQLLTNTADVSSTGVANCPQGCGAGNVSYQWAIYSAYVF
jgi:serine protease